MSNFLFLQNLGALQNNEIQFGKPRSCGTDLRQHGVEVTWKSFLPRGISVSLVCTLDMLWI